MFVVKEPRNRPSITSHSPCLPHSQLFEIKLKVTGSARHAVAIACLPRSSCRRGAAARAGHGQPSDAQKPRIGPHGERHTDTDLEAIARAALRLDSFASRSRSFDFLDSPHLCTGTPGFPFAKKKKKTNQQHVRGPRFLSLPYWRRGRRSKTRGICLSLTALRKRWVLWRAERHRCDRRFPGNDIGALVSIVG